VGKWLFGPRERIATLELLLGGIRLGSWSKLPHFRRSKEDKKIRMDGNRRWKAVRAMD
jgi:hypothetical protein